MQGEGEELGGEGRGDGAGWNPWIVGGYDDLESRVVLEKAAFPSDLKFYFQKRGECKCWCDFPAKKL